MTALALTTFTGTFALSLYAIAVTVLPRRDRIVSALRGQVQPMFLETTR